MSSLLNAKDLKERASINELLERLGFKPVRKTGKEHFYVSMLRDDDHTPSFAVDDALGVWFDHGTGKGGNIIDFGLAFWQELTFHEVVLKLQDKSLLSLASLPLPRKHLSEKIPNYVVEQIKPIGSHPAITGYLKSRGVLEMARKDMKEVYYYIENSSGQRRRYFSAGWQNSLGGWEVRNKYFKGCLGHKSITRLPGNQKKLAMFEGFINYLSWRTENVLADDSVIVLNSLSMLGIARQEAINYPDINIYFDRDNQGVLATKDLIKKLPYARDKSMVYDGFNDYNDKIMQQEKLSRARTAQVFSGSSLNR
ncbi:hypothetical protein EOD41_14895 [Mucilaginibacter limnophilus]|uniref:Zinc finger CHC2-type domain-containing protein n=1 Tax=Mucilaginibacter limnophilus TaxID=1932778 RepID=A0A3S2UJQ6_9SPHI|nr:CHC2 zinc finger domain-containing protein [Mucilaginibacter limnophilus]RVT99729.1 hypothetical protein EOD41_14895 [Mucilaginibacter limnophilus]